MTQPSHPKDHHGHDQGHDENPHGAHDGHDHDHRGDPGHDHTHEAPGHDGSHEKHHQHDHHDHQHDHQGHHHDHRGELLGTPERRLRWALALTLGFLGVEAVAGFLSGSLALLSDAGHMLTDAGALALALFAQRLAARPRTATHTFGFRRAEILGALLNGAVLGAGALWVIIEAVRRLADPPEVLSGWMIATAAVGLLINLAAAYILGHGHGHSLNERAALAHVLSDAAGSVAALVAALLIRYGGIYQADPIASILISLIILWGSLGLLRGSISVLMESAPAQLVEAITKTIRETPGVRDFHDLHLWHISEGLPVLMVHVVLDGTAHGTEVARAVAERVRERHQISHATVQPEAPPPEEQLVSLRSRRA
jgi:cobalt-zinc-cadmium efflux system protein